MRPIIVYLSYVWLILMNLQNVENLNNDETLLSFHSYNILYAPGSGHTTTNPIEVMIIYLIYFEHSETPSLFLWIS